MSNVGELARYTFAQFRPPRKQTVSEWADENRILTSESSAEPGPWRTDRAPFQREIMDAFNDPAIHEIVIKAGSQVGKTEIEINMMGYVMCIDPGPMIFVQPSSLFAEDFSKRRIAPAIRACRALRERVEDAKGRDSGNTILMKNFPGGSVALVGANSPTELAGRPVRYIFMDEIDRFPASAGTEGDPIALTEKRAETFRNRKIIKTSTPTYKETSKIEKAYLRGTQEEWHIECPHCHSYSFIRFEQIKFTREKYHDADGEKHYRVSDVHWECPICHGGASEYEMKRQPGKWVTRNEKALEQGIRSFRLNAFCSPWSRWNELCIEFLESKDDPESLKVFTNTRLGECWEINEKRGVPETLYGRREHYEAEVPDGALVLTMGVDTQDNRLEYEIVGWSENEESWGIAYGIIPGRADAPGVWEEIDNLLERQWTRRNGMGMRVLCTFMDSGGHFTEYVYRECARRASRRMFAIKGEAGQGKEYVRRMKNSVQTGVWRFLISVDAGKEAIMYQTTVEQPGPRYMHFPIDARAGYSLEYFRGLISERQVVHRRMGRAVMTWEKTRERNEPLDCRNYALAAYRAFNWDFRKFKEIIGKDGAEGESEPPRRKKKKSPVIGRGIQL